ncbi:hypothetical protein SAMD00023353_2200090 [Rosellinia necatrix]|uniref:Uncharacterized protein n=1 Tax=Rosellinia necatrix TaxID=77044 RepID=A0A1S8A7P7_ROSNE|nr:hypothetical protein SAMD00023353_2200090 [Rosellinia necatrix]
MALLPSLKPRKVTDAEREIRRSFGIGGAGNIRTRDQAVVHGEYDLAERRRSRAGSWSTDPTAGARTDRRSSSFSEVLKRTFTGSSK